MNFSDSLKQKLQVALYLPVPVLLIPALLLKKSFAGEIIISFLPNIAVTGALIILLALILHLVTKRITLLSLILLALNVALVGYGIYIVSAFYVSKDELSQSQNSLSILSINMLYKNRQLEKFDQKVAELDPDVVALMEVNEQNYSQLEFVKNYPYEQGYLSDRYKFSTVFLSKYPLNVYRVYSEVPRYKATASSVELMNGTKMYKLYLYHNTAPASPQALNERNSELGAFAQLLNEDRSENILAFGDYNVSPWSYYYSRFVQEVDSKFYDATKYGGPYITWTMDRYLLPVASHIDHFFVSKNLEVSNVDVIDMPGSDHKGVFVEVVK